MQHTVPFHIRLRAARKAAGFKTSKSFIDKYDIPASTYSQHESGARTPDDDVIEYYSKTFRVNHSWLKDGKGTPYATSKASTKQKASNEKLSEALYEIKSHGQSISTLNTKLFEEIITKLFELESINLKKDKLRKLIKHAVAIYSDIMTTTPESEDLQMRMLNMALKTLKRLTIT